MVPRPLALQLQVSAPTLNARIHRLRRTPAQLRVARTMFRTALSSLRGRQATAAPAPHARAPSRQRRAQHVTGAKETSLKLAPRRAHSRMSAPSSANSGSPADLCGSAPQSATAARKTASDAVRPNLPPELVPVFDKHRRPFKRLRETQPNRALFGSVVARVMWRQALLRLAGALFVVGRGT